MRVRELKTVVMKYDPGSWKRLLEFLRQECSHSRNRLAEVLAGSNGKKETLSLAENFLNRMIQLETMTSLLKNDIRQVEAWEMRVAHGDTEAEVRLNGDVIRINRDLEKLEAEFRRCKKDFDDFLLQTVLD